MITIQDAKKLFASLLQMINGELNSIKDKIGERKVTLRTESSQHVDSLTKVRFFSSRILIDSLFSKFLGQPSVKDEWFYSRGKFNSSL